MFVKLCIFLNRVMMHRSFLSKLRISMLIEPHLFLLTIEFQGEAHVIISLDSERLHNLRNSCSALLSICYSSSAPNAPYALQRFEVIFRNFHLLIDTGYFYCMLFCRA